MNKQSVPKETKEMSPTPDPGSELLGSLTTQQQQRTSARVIKKLKLEPPGDKKKRSDGASDEIPECDTPSKITEELKFPTVKQRMPKALWSTDEKNLFFEALNEYGKDFDAITAYICAKMKKKGMPENLKTKTQVSHFYYRTWHKLSKHVRFDENVKKVAQELYALINYGELRKKLVSVNEKTCGRLGEMVLGGSIMVRARGRNLRVRTPMCRALRRLNQITEPACPRSRVCARCVVVLRARSSAAWARVQAAAHNPRAAVALDPRAALRALLAALARRWRLQPGYKHKPADDEDSQGRRDDGDHLNLETDRIIVEESKRPRKLSLHVGPRAGAELRLPAVAPSEPPASHNICLTSYLARQAGQRPRPAKIRTPKRQRKDSATEKDKEVDQKRVKMEEESTKLINIEETAIDGIELMASYKNNQEDERPSTEDEKELKEEIDLRVEEETDDPIKDKEDVLKEREDVGREREMSEKEKDSFSEMEDDEKYAKSDTDNESDHGKGKERKFKNLKVKFRIRPKKRGGSEYSVVREPPVGPEPAEGPEPPAGAEPPAVDVQLALRQLRKGWSLHDAGDLTIGDLYLMFGNRSKLELDYWWAEATPPLPHHSHTRTEKTDKTEKKEKTPDKDSSVEDDKAARESDADIFSPKNTFSQDSNDGSGDEKKTPQLQSPEQAPAGGVLQLARKLVNRPEPAAPPARAGLSALSDRLSRLLSLVGNIHVGNSHAGNSHAGGAARCGCAGACARCACGPACSRRPRAAPAPAARPDHPFRHPPPIAPRPDHDPAPALDLSGVPRGRRGRREPARRVVVQRLLPLLPKLPPPSPLLPVKMVPDSPPAPPRILPKPPPTSTSDLSFFYVLSESNGQFFFHDGDRRIPITAPNGADHPIETLIVKDEGSDEPEEPSTSTSGEVIDPGVRDETEAKVEKTDSRDISSLLRSESMSLSPSRLLRDTDAWLDASAHDFSLSSFLGHLDSRPPDLAVDSQLHSLMAESSVDYVAKFADLAAEVTDGVDPLAPDDLT